VFACGSDVVGLIYGRLGGVEPYGKLPMLWLVPEASEDPPPQAERRGKAQTVLSF